MEWISLSAIISSIVVTLATAAGVVFCKPLYDCFKATVEALCDPQSLDGDANELKQLLNDIKAMDRSDVINKWIGEADEIIRQIQQLWQQESGSSNHNDDRPPNCLHLSCDACSRCNLLRKIKKLIAQGEIIKRPTLGRRTVVHIDDVPNIEDGTTTKRNLKQVMDMLNDDDVWCIGVWGPGGVGKTTLAKTLNNKLEGNSPFNLVRLIELKANDGDSEVQKAIAKSLGLSTKEGTEGQEAISNGLKDQIHNTLQGEKFLLILDNVWSESMQLSSIGISKGQNGSKIILTTRSRRVCTNIGAKEIKIKCLTIEEAWQLFAEKAGEVVNDEKIKPVAQEVCQECDCLPLALVIVGSVMKGQTNIIEWQNAVNKLRGSVPMDAKIESKVYNPLKLSYDSLDDALKHCFLYCSLYPEGYHIEKNELVQCWLAENLINEQSYYTDAYNEALGLINRLKDSCLLEEVSTNNDGLGLIRWGESFLLEEESIKDEETQAVKMHDVVRDVARWIGKSMKKSVVFSRYGVSLRPTVTLPDDAKNFQWISFVDNREIKLPEYEKDYPSVTTLLIHGGSCDDYIYVPTEFLRGFRAVKVLIMEGVDTFGAYPLQLEELQALILNGCGEITEVPKANNLKILHLSGSFGLCNMPGRMKKLSNLRVLNLSDNFSLKRIDADTILGMNSLEVLDMSKTGYKWPARKRSGSEDATLQDLSGLKLLREVYLQLAETDITYVECRWMERLKRFFFAYNYPANSRFKGKIIWIQEGTKIGSFILHAEKLVLFRIRSSVRKVFLNFSSTDESNSKLKALKIEQSKFDPMDAKTVPKCSFISNVEELDLSVNKRFIGFREITYSLGASFAKLKSLCLWVSEYVFCSDDLHIVLPELERLSVSCYKGRRVFECNLAKIQAIAPKLKTLKVEYSFSLERPCYFESNDQWTSLEILRVKYCPRLKEFPLMPSIKEIRGELDWWNTAHWRSEETKSCFTPL